MLNVLKWLEDMWFDIFCEERCAKGAARYCHLNFQRLQSLVAQLTDPESSETQLAILFTDEIHT